MTPQYSVGAEQVAAHLKACTESREALLAAARLAVQHFKRNEASGNWQGDDEHEAWEALAWAIAHAEASRV